MDNSGANTLLDIKKDSQISVWTERKVNVFPKGWDFLWPDRIGKSYSSRCEVADMSCFLPTPVSCQHSKVIIKSHLCHHCPSCFFRPCFPILAWSFLCNMRQLSNFLKIVFSSLEKDTIIYGGKTWVRKILWKPGMHESGIVWGFYLLFFVLEPGLMHRSHSFMFRLSVLNSYL